MLQTLIEWRTRWSQRYHLRELARRRALGYDLPAPPITDEEFRAAWDSRPWKCAPLELGKTGGFAVPSSTRGNWTRFIELSKQACIFCPQ